MAKAEKTIQVGVVRIDHVEIPESLYLDLVEACRIRQEIDEDSDMDARPRLFIHDFEESPDKLMEWARATLDFGEDERRGVELDL